jgi:hypothetical protein
MYHSSYVKKKGCGLDDRVSIPGKGKIFSATASRLTLGVHLVSSSLGTEGIAARADADHSSEVKNGGHLRVVGLVLN